MATVYQLPSGKFRGMARVSRMKAKTQTFNTYRQAERWASDTEAEMRGELRNTPQEATKITFDELVKEYLTCKEFVRTAPSSQRVIRRQLATLQEFFSGRYLSDITVKEIERYSEKRLTSYSKKQPDRLLSESKVRLELTYLSALFKLARRREYTTERPFEFIERPKGKAKEIRINYREQGLLNEQFGYLNDNGQALIFYTLLMSLGCRPGELAKLRLEDLRFDSKSVFLTKTKNTHSRTVPVADSQWAYFLDWLARPSRPLDCPYVFPQRDKSRKKWIEFHYETWWYKAKEKLTGRINPLITPHSYRHEAISRWFETTTMSDAQIMLLSGHRDYKSLQVYTHIRAERLKPFIEQADKTEEMLEVWVADTIAVNLSSSPSLHLNYSIHETVEREIKGVKSTWQ